MKEDDELLSFKIITIGNCGVGKTSILQRFIDGTFNEDLMPTLGMNNKIKINTLKNGKKIILKLFDTAGEEKYRSLSKSFFKNVDGVLFVYALNDKNSFENLIKTFIDNHNGKKDIPLYLIENKNDLEKEVDKELVNEFLLDNINFKFKSISAKLNKDNSINELFQEISEILYINYKDSGKENIKQKFIKIENYSEKYKKINSCSLCEVE